jgi:hypothetical protein
MSIEYEDGRELEKLGMVSESSTVTQYKIQQSKSPNISEMGKETKVP